MELQNLCSIAPVNTRFLTWQLYAGTRELTTLEITNVINSWSFHRLTYIFIQHKKTGLEVGLHITLYLVFYGKNFTPNPITLEFKIKEVLSAF